MVIAEALTAIKDLDRRRRTLRNHLRDNVFVLPGLTAEEIPDGVETLLEEFKAVIEEIADLKVRIVKTNVMTNLSITKVEEADPVEVSILEAIKLMESYRELEQRYNDVAELMESKQARFFSQGGFRSDQAIQLNPNFISSAAEVRLKAGFYRTGARHIEQAIIKKNWATELL